MAAAAGEIVNGGGEGLGRREVEIVNGGGERKGVGRREAKGKWRAVESGKRREISVRGEKGKSGRAKDV